MPRFALFDLVKWLHFVCVSTAGGAAVAGLHVDAQDDRPVVGLHLAQPGNPFGRFPICHARIR